MVKPKMTQQEFDRIRQECEQEIVKPKINISKNIGKKEQQ